MKKLIAYIIALTNLYGIITKQKVVEIYNSQNTDTTSLTEVSWQLQHPDEALEKHYVYPYEDCFVSQSVLEFDECESLLAEQAGKPHYVPEQAKLLRYVESKYFEETEAYRQLLTYIRQHFYPEDEQKALDLAEDIQGSCQIDLNVPVLMKEFTRRDLVFADQNQANDTMQLVMEVYRNTRLWQNCGHTPKELFEQYDRPNLLPLPDKPWQADIVDIKTGQKIGRNDPCPCGSGRKYKMCCLGKSPADDSSD